MTADPDPAVLGIAWSEASDVLPANWGIWLRPTLGGDGYEASARPNGMWYLRDGPLPERTGEGPTPAAALNALARDLIARQSTPAAFLSTGTTVDGRKWFTVDFADPVAVPVAVRPFDEPEDRA